MNWKKEYERLLNRAERRAVREEAMRVFGITSATFYNWLRGKTEPKPYIIEKLGDIILDKIANCDTGPELAPDTSKA